VLPCRSALLHHLAAFRGIHRIGPSERMGLLSVAAVFAVGVSAMPLWPGDNVGPLPTFNCDTEFTFLQEGPIGRGKLRTGQVAHTHTPSRDCSTTQIHTHARTHTHTYIHAAGQGTRRRWSGKEKLTLTLTLTLTLPITITRCRVPEGGVAGKGRCHWQDVWT
jgi:hypothetical protein